VRWPKQTGWSAPLQSRISMERNTLRAEGNPVGNFAQASDACALPARDGACMLRIAG
jgi:hypothetical protein